MISEVLMKPGSWQLRLREDTPKSILDAVDWNVTATAGFGHVFVFSTRVSPALLSDASLKAVAIYAGILRELPDARTLGGPGMVAWLGDEDDKGDILETAVTQSAATLQTWVNALRPAALSAGTSLNSGSYTGTFQWVTRRKALDAVCAALGYEYRVNADGTLDANTVATLYGSTPVAVVTRTSEERASYVGILANELESGRDLDDYTTKVRTIAKTGLGTASGAATPYKDINGNSIVVTRVIETPESEDPNAAATALINRFSAARKTLRLSTDTYALHGNVRVGQSVYVFDPRAGLIDTANQIIFAGQIIAPVSLRVYGLSWPIREGMGVAFRNGAGTWTDLTDWVEWDTGDTKLDVGGYMRTLDGNPAYVGTAGIMPAVDEGGWVAYTPTWSGTLGDGTLVGAYRRIGSTVHFRIKLIWGTTTSHAASGQNFGLPITANGTYAFLHPVGTAISYNSGLAKFTGTARTESTSVVQVTTNSTNGDVSDTAPFTWGNLDEMMISGTYEAQIT